MVTMMMMMMTMMMMMMTKTTTTVALTQSIFKLGPPDFAWKQIYIISTS